MLSKQLNYQRYKITLRPWLWLLTLRKNSQVFQQQTLSAILTSIFNDAGFSGNYTLGSLPSDERNYCVQYNETDFDFVQRLLAEQGINVARRTIAKYRESLSIPPSNQRKSLL